MIIKFTCGIFSLLLLFIIGGSESANQNTLNAHNLSGRITISLKHGVWKIWQEKRVYQDITLDLVCKKGQCEEEVYGWAPKYNQDVDHQGKVEVTHQQNAWLAKVKMKIRPHPWTIDSEEAEYKIEFLPYQKNQIIGSYTGRFSGQFLLGKVTGIINSNLSTPVANHQPIKPQEHPRLAFRASELEAIRIKAKKDYGQAILQRLNQTLEGKIYYDGYGPNGGWHAAGHCFLALLNQDLIAAEKGWQLTQKTIANSAPRVLEQSQIVAGIALAYDLCYPIWEPEKRRALTQWLASQSVKLINGGGEGWNGSTVSNWNARARSAGGLAALAIMEEPEEFFGDDQYFNSVDNFWLYLKTAQRNIQRYLALAIGERGFGTEGDSYTRDSMLLILPFLQAYRNVLGQDYVTGSSAEWILPHYVMRIVEQDGKIYLPPYGRHRYGPTGSFFALGLSTTSERFLPAVLWFFDRHFGWEGDRSFGIGQDTPHDAIYALVGYREDTPRQNPAAILDKVLVDEQKGFFVFRNQWQDEHDVVASIYLKRQPRVGGWSFPEVGSFRITGLGTNWAMAGPGDGKPESENIVHLAEAKAWETAQIVSSFFNQNGSGVITMKMNDIVVPKTEPPVRISSLRSFAVDYSGASGTPALFAVVDRFSGATSQEHLVNNNWIMHTTGNVTIEGRKFMIKNQSGATLQGIFVTPEEVNISYQKNEQGGKIIANGGEQFFVVMTIQKGKAPALKIYGNSSLDARVDVGGQTLRFINNRLVLEQF